MVFSIKDRNSDRKMGGILSIVSILIFVMMEELLLEENIISVHIDLGIWVAMSAGFDADKNFVVDLLYDKMEDEEPARRFRKKIVIDRKGTEKLADKIHNGIGPSESFCQRIWQG